MVYDRSGESVCGSCGDYWNSHTLGGNCRMGALSENDRAILLQATAGNRAQIKNSKVMSE